MAYLKFIGAVFLIFCALTFTFWALSIAVRLYFDKKYPDQGLADKITEIDEEVRRGN